MPVTSDAERPLRMHGGLSPGAPKANRNAFKHGRYTERSYCYATINSSSPAGEIYSSKSPPLLHELQSSAIPREMTL